MKPVTFSHHLLGLTLACALALSACGGSDGPAPQAFTLNAQFVTASLEQETLPYAGIVKAANINTQGRDDDAQIIYPFVGFESSDGEGHSKIGNAKTGTTARMLARLYPNPKFIAPSADVKIYPMVADQKDGTHCLKTQEDGQLSLVKLSFVDIERANGAASRGIDASELSPCTAISLAAATRGRPLEMAISMHMDTPTMLIWRFAIEFPDGRWAFISAKDDPSEDLPPEKNMLIGTGATAMAFINFNAPQPSALPANTVAHGSFRPAHDGFGFANTGDGSYDLYSASDIARNFGQDTVCFVKDDQCVGLNPLGYHFKNNLNFYQELASNGLCYGYAMAAMAVHQQAYYGGKKYLSDYNPKATSTSELNYRDVRPLVANLFISQFSRATRQYEREACAQLLPSQAIQRIEERFDSYNPIASLSIYEVDPITKEAEDGHAVTPWAISDEGNGIKRIYVYDNNFPGDANRYITVDTQQETWFYSAQANASAAEAKYKGEGNFNPICPTPLSVGIEHSEIAIQAKGTTRFVDFSDKHSQVVDAGGRISGADFETQTNTNNIPGATLEKFMNANALVIPVPDPSDALTDIDRNNVQTYLDQMYTVNAMSVDENATQTFYMNQSTLLDGDVSVAYNFRAQMTEVNMNDVVTFKAHASARIVAVERFKATQTRTVQLETFITLDTEQTGYSTQIDIDATQVSQDAVGFFIKDNGRDVVVFEYDPKGAAATFTAISPGAYSLETTQFNPDGTTEMLISAE
jgi:hypothetical protein